MAKVSFTYACLGGNFPNYSAPWSINTFTDIHAASGRWDLGRAQLERNVGYSILSQQCFGTTFFKQVCMFGQLHAVRGACPGLVFRICMNTKIRASPAVKYLPKQKFSFLSSNFYSDFHHPLCGRDYPDPCPLIQLQIKWAGLISW